MADPNEYIKISSLNIEKETLIPIYQVQPDKNTASIVKVGEFEEVPYVSINKFSLRPDLHCRIISCFYSAEELGTVYSHNDVNFFDIIKFVTFNPEDPEIPLSCLTISFCSCEDITIKKDKTTLSGNFSLIYYSAKLEHQKKFSILRTYDIYPPYENILEDSIVKLHEIYKKDNEKII